MQVFFGIGDILGTVWNWMDNLTDLTPKRNRKTKSQYDMMREIAEDVEFEEIMVNENREQNTIKMLE